MDDDFVKMAKLLVPYILSRDMMVTKRINGMEVTGKEMSNYVRVSILSLYTIFDIYIFSAPMKIYEKLYLYSMIVISASYH